MSGFRQFAGSIGEGNRNNSKFLTYDKFEKDYASKVKVPAEGLGGDSKKKGIVTEAMKAAWAEQNEKELRDLQRRNAKQRESIQNFDKKQEANKEKSFDVSHSHCL